MATLFLDSKPSNTNGKISWPEAPSIKQYFSLPDSIIYYISKSPSTPKVYQKLVMCCKYFFEKLPVIVTARITYHGLMLCSKNKEECKNGNQQCCVITNISNISSKIWLTNELDLFMVFAPNFASILVPKIYRCEEAVVKFKSAFFNLKDFQLFASKFQKFNLTGNVIISDDGSVVKLEKILEKCTNVKEFEYSFGLHTPAATVLTMKNINKLTNLDKLKKIHLRQIPEIIDVEDLDKLIKKHKDAKIELDFRSNISQHYKAHLDQLIDAVIVSNVQNCLIRYYGQDEEKLNIMDDRYSC